MKILQYMVINEKSGLTNYILQNFNYVDKDKFEIAILSRHEKLDFMEEYQNKGAKFYILQSPIKFFSFTKNLKSIKKDGYNVIHINLSYNNFIILLAAKIAGFKVIILHSHSTNIDEKTLYKRVIKTIIHRIGKILTPFLATDYLACSHLAAKWMFSDKIINNKFYSVVHNAINLDDFVYEKSKKEQKLKEFNINNNCFIVGHIGRISYQKNQEFLLKVFYEIVNINPNSKLLIIGGYADKDKILFEDMKKLTNELNLNDKVLYLGKRNDVKELMQIMDCFVLPSLFEGLPIVGIEAQAMGLHTFFSTNITREVGITNLAHFLSLNKTPKLWANEILKYKNQLRESPIIQLNDSGYNIKEEIKKIEFIYKGNKIC